LTHKPLLEVRRMSTTFGQLKELKRVLFAHGQEADYYWILGQTKKRDYDLSFLHWVSGQWVHYKEEVQHKEEPPP